MKSTDLAIQFLAGRDSAWISVKQAAWLVNLIVKETQNPRPGRTLGVPDTDYNLSIAPNGAGLLQRRAERVQRMSREEFEHLRKE